MRSRPVPAALVACAAVVAWLVWFALRDESPAVPATPFAEPVVRTPSERAPRAPRERATAPDTVQSPAKPGETDRPRVAQSPLRTLDASIARARELRNGAAALGDPAARAAQIDAAAALERELTPFVGALVRGELRGGDAARTLLADAALADRFLTSAAPVEVDGTRRTKSQPLAEHVVIRFPAGVHRFSPAGFASENPSTRTVVVEGAGRDETALVGWTRWDAPKDGPRWTFRDCTVDTGGEEFVHGGGPAEFRLERVRLVGCDSGAGGSEMFDADGLVVAHDCRFEAGFGGSPGHVNLFEGSRLAVRLDRCAFVGPFEEFSRGAIVVSTDCTFESAPRGFAHTVESATEDEAAGALRKQGLWFFDCRVTSEFTELTRWPRRTLADLNPAWTAERR